MDQDNRAFFAVFTNPTLLQLITTFHADSFLPFINQNRVFWLNYHFERISGNYPAQFAVDAKYLRERENLPYYEFIHKTALYPEYLKYVYDTQCLEEIYDIGIPFHSFAAIHFGHKNIFELIIKHTKEYAFYDCLTQICANKEDSGRWFDWLYARACKK